MKEFAAKHIHGLITLLCVLGLTVISLSVFAGGAFRAVYKRSESEKILNRAEYAASIDRLLNAIDSGDEKIMYHCAVEASENAAMIGEREASVMFGNIAQSFLDSSENIAEIRNRVEQYAQNGEIDGDGAAEQAEINEEEIMSAAFYRNEAAEACVSRLFGQYNPLRREMKSRNGEILYSCSNAYAVIDSRTGQPIEAAVSLPPAEIRLNEEKCVAEAFRFLREYFPRDVAENTSVTGIEPDDWSGTYNISMISKNRNITLSVRRDNGRVVRLTTR